MTCFGRFAVLFAQFVGLSRGAVSSWHESRHRISNKVSSLVEVMQSNASAGLKTATEPSYYHLDSSAVTVFNTTSASGGRFASLGSMEFWKGVDGPEFSFGDVKNDGSYGNCSYFGDQQIATGCCGSQPYLYQHLSSWLKIQKGAAETLRKSGTVDGAIVYTCVKIEQDSEGECGGLGDRWTGIQLAFFLAVALKRPFFINVYYPDAMQNYFLPRRSCDGSAFVPWVWPLVGPSIDVQYHLENGRWNKGSVKGETDIIFDGWHSAIEAIKQDHRSVYVRGHLYQPNEVLGYLFSSEESRAIFGGGDESVHKIRSQKFQKYNSAYKNFKNMFELLFEPSAFVQTAISITARATGLVGVDPCRLGFSRDDFSSVFVFGPAAAPFCRPWVSVHIRAGDDNFERHDLSSIPDVNDFFDCAEEFQHTFASPDNVPIFLASDQAAIGRHPRVQKLKESGLLADSTFARPVHTDTYFPGAAGPLNGSEYLRSLAFTIADWFLLSNSLAFCKTGSSTFSASAAKLGGVPQSNVKDISTNWRESSQRAY